MLVKAYGVQRIDASFQVATPYFMPITYYYTYASKIVVRVNKMSSIMFTETRWRPYKPEVIITNAL